MGKDNSQKSDKDKDSDDGQSDDEDIIDSGGDANGENNNGQNGKPPEAKEQIAIFFPALRYVGIVLIVLSFLSFSSLLVCFIFDEWFAAYPFILTGIGSGLIGSVLARIGRKLEQPSLFQIFWMGAFAWLVISIAGSFPFYFIGINMADDIHLKDAAGVYGQYINALFESVSGFTGTGLTLVSGQEDKLPATLQWWRTISQWVGGLGFISLVLMYIQPSYRSHLALESELDDQDLHSNPKVMAQHLWMIYAVLTFLSIGLLACLDLSLWQAINYGITGISTGGFGITPNSMGDFSRLAQWIMMVIIITGAINFAVYDKVYHRAFSALKEDRQLIWYLSGLPVLLSLIILANFLSGQQSIDFTDLVFQGISAAASAGFSTQSTADWPTSILLLLMLAMVVGGCKGSTAGGMKISRLRYLARLIFHFIRQTRNRPDVLFTFHGDKIKARFTRETYQAITLAFLWFMTGVIGIFLLSFSLNAELSKITFEVYSALGCVGLSNGLTNPDMDTGGKLVLMALMWLGRLEIIPIFAFVLAPFYRG